MKKYNRVKSSSFLNRNRKQNFRKKMKKSTWKAFIKENSEERMNREIIIIIIIV